MSTSRSWGSRPDGLNIGTRVYFNGLRRPPQLGKSPPSFYGVGRRLDQLARSDLPVYLHRQEVTGYLPPFLRERGF